MRSRVSLGITIVLAGASFLPFAAHAAIPFFGPIIPQANNLCPAGWGMVIIVINNLISFAFSLILVFIAPLTIGYAGLLYVLNPMNPSGMSKARSLLLNTVVGVVVALAAWLIIDAVMAVFYHPTDPLLAGQTWTALLNSQGQPVCLKQAASLYRLNSGNLQVSGLGANGTQYLAPVSGDCSVDALVKNGINPAIANTMSCIAQKESSCNLTAANPGSSAYGLFQIVNGYNDTGHNLNFPTCTQAAQAAGFTQFQGNLNCHNAVVTGGAQNPNEVTLYNACRAASSNPACNAAAAQWLYDHNGGFKNWVTASSCGV